MEGVILIPKRMMFWRGVNVFSRFWGEWEILMSIDKRKKL